MLLHIIIVPISLYDCVELGVKLCGTNPSPAPYYGNVQYDTSTIRTGI